ncbi:MAG: hypothetical protein JNK14_21165 [Chitinophagaceae bacterium]|nr:hypothetical protein [Chitinophagaceae bacterium]
MKPSVISEYDDLYALKQDKKAAERSMAMRMIQSSFNKRIRIRLND